MTSLLLVITDSIAVWRDRRHAVLMIRALDYGNSDTVSIPGWGSALCSWARHLTLIVSLSNQDGV